jgi:hypothetical protein
MDSITPRLDVHQPSQLVYSAPFFQEIPLADILGPAIQDYLDTNLPILLPPYIDPAAEAAVAATALLRAGDTATGRLYTTQTLPASDNELTTKLYVDTTLAGVQQFPEAPAGPPVFGRNAGNWLQVLPLSGGTMSGALNYTATGATTSRSAQDRAADVANVLDFGADHTGVVDSAPAINAALATGKPTYLPKGSYLVRSAINCGSGSVLYGAGRGATNILVDQTFSSSAPGVIVLTGREQTSPIVSDMGMVFAQPTDQASRANFKTLAAGGTSGLGGTGVMYPPGVFSNDSNRFKVERMRFDSAWNGIWSDNGAQFIDEIEMGALNVGIRIGNSRDSVIISRVHFWNYGFNAGNALYTGVFRDGNTWALRLGEANGAEVNLLNFTSSSGSVYLTNANTSISAIDLNIGDGAVLDIEGGASAQITGLGVVGIPDNPSASMLTYAGGNLEITNAFLTSGSRPVLTVNGGVISISGSALGSNAHSPNYPVVVQTGGQLFLKSSTLNVNDFSLGAWTTPIIQVTAGNATQITGCLFSQRSTTPSTIPCISLPGDSATYYVAGNNFGNWTFTPPITPGVATLGFYGFNSDGFVQLGGQGRAGQVNFCRADDGFSRAWVGFTTDSTAVSLVNTSGTNPTVSLNSAQSNGRVSLQVNGVEYVRITSSGLGLAVLPTNAANDAAAATAGVPVAGVYRNGSVMMVRVV